MLRRVLYPAAWHEQCQVPLAMLILRPAKFITTVDELKRRRGQQLESKTRVQFLFEPFQTSIIDRIFQARMLAIGPRRSRTFVSALSERRPRPLDDRTVVGMAGLEPMIPWSQTTWAARSCVAPKRSAHRLNAASSSAKSPSSKSWAPANPSTRPLQHIEVKVTTRPEVTWEMPFDQASWGR